MTMNGIASEPPGSSSAKKRRMASAASSGSMSSWNEDDGTMIVPIAPGQPEGLHPAEVHAPVDVEARGRGLGMEALQHVGRVVHALDVDALGEEVEKESAGPRSDVEHRFPPLGQ